MKWVKTFFIHYDFELNEFPEYNHLSKSDPYFENKVSIAKNNENQWNHGIFSWNFILQLGSYLDRRNGRHAFWPLNQNHGLIFNSQMFALEALVIKNEYSIMNPINQLVITSWNVWPENSHHREGGSTKQVKLLFIQHKQSSWIQAK